VLLRLGRRSVAGSWLAIAAFHLIALGIANVVLAWNGDLTQSVRLIIQANPLFRLIEFFTGVCTGLVFVRGWRLPAVPGTKFFHTLIEIAAAGLLVLSMRTGPLGESMFRAAAWIDWQSMMVWLSKGGSSLLASALLIWVLASSRGLLGRLLVHPFPVFLGRISFAFFMVHYIVLNQVARVCDENASAVMLAGAAYFVSTGVAALMHVLVELPGRRIALAMLLRGRLARGTPGSTRQPPGRLTGNVAIACLGMGLGFLVLLASERSWFVRPGSGLVGWNGNELSGSVVFEGEAILHHVEATRTDDRLDLILIWQGLPTRKRERFVHLCEATGQIVRQMPYNRSLFAGGQFAVDRITIPADWLQNVAFVGVGFWRRSLGSAPVNALPSSLQGKRLHVYDCDADCVPELITTPAHQ
jgi:hypothetical protein